MRTRSGRDGLGSFRKLLLSCGVNKNFRTQPIPVRRDINHILRCQTCNTEKKRSDQGSSASAYFQLKKLVRLASVDHIASAMSANTQPGDGSLGSPRPHPVPERPTKRQKIAVACDACRTRKVKCDGIRPSESCSPWVLAQRCLC